MPLSTFDFAMAIAVVVMMPIIIWVNYKKREGGLQGYLWREHPTLVWIGLIFLGLLVLSSAARLLTHFGVLSLDTENLLAIVLGVPMFVLSLGVIVLGSLAAIKYFQNRPST